MNTPVDGDAGVADVKDVPSLTRQAIIRAYGLGKQRYEISFNNRLIKVNKYTPPFIRTLWTSQSNINYFHFRWEQDLAVKVKVNDAIHEATVELNECPSATLAPIYDEIYALTEQGAYAVKIAGIRIDKLLLWHVCTMAGKYCPSNNRILSGNGLRYCAWNSTCTRRGTITKVIFSKRQSLNLCRSSLQSLSQR